jgi:homoserine O-acetyltransferase
MNYFHLKEEFQLERGGVLPELSIAYKTYGNLATAKRVVWVCHALTANADVAEWWTGMVGAQAAFDPAHDFIVCANILGSCYGTTGPISLNPVLNRPYYETFPMITIRDMVNAHQILRKALQIEKIHCLVGGSMGGYQALEWILAEPELFDELILLATSATESAWGIAIHTAQRMALENDPLWNNASPEAGSNGLKVARAIGMLTYRNYQLLVEKQSDNDNYKLDNFKASSYMIYQGDKLSKRFNAYCYWHLTKAMDTHHIARGTEQSIADRLQSIKAKTLVIGISSDILCPVTEQEFLAKYIPQAHLHIIDSTYGHDGFIVEAKAITKIIREWSRRK